MTEEVMLKQFVLISKDLKQDVGKAVSQGIHASYMALEKQRQTNPELVKKWEESGQCVIVLECKNVTKLIGADIYCKEWKIVGHLYVDEGFTQVEPMTPTCFATGVLTPEQQIFFSKFKLYNTSIINQIQRKILNLRKKKT